MKTFKKIFFLLHEYKNKLFLIFFNFLILSIIDILSLAIIFPYLKIVTNPGKIYEINFVNNFELIKNLQINNIIILLSVFLILVFFIKAIVNYLVNLYIISFSQKIELNLRNKLLQSLYNTNFIDFKLKNTSEYLYKINNLVSIFSNIVLANSLKIFCDIIICLVISITLLVMTEKFFLILLIALFLYALIFNLWFGPKLKQNGEELNSNQKKLLKVYGEILVGFKSLEFIEGRIFLKERFQAVAKKIMSNKIFHLIIPLVPRFFSEFLLIVFFIGLVIFFVNKENNIMSMIPIFGVFGLAAIRLIPILNSMSYGVSKFNDSINTVDILFNELSKNTTNLTVQKNHNIKTEKFKNLKIIGGSFSFDKNSTTLEEINLELNNNEIIGIIGPSGSGKSTILDILIGINSLKKGKYVFNGKDFYSFQENFKNNFFYANQDPFIIDDTLLSNITFKNEEDLKSSDLFEINKILNLLGWDKDINLRKIKLNTVLGENGNKISGGQKQRVIVARALYLQKKILILDEPTSALDEKTSENLVKILNQFNNYFSVVLITHQTNLKKYCKRVYEIKDKKLTILKK